MTVDTWHANDHRHLFGSLTRRADILRITRPGGVGIELGVAEGAFGTELLGREHLSHLFGVDMYAGDRTHGTDEYKRALTALKPWHPRSTLLRMRFDEAEDLFADECADLIYVDGYAHTGEEEGTTFTAWYPKLRSGGVFAGHDYTPDYPLVVHHVDRFVAERGLELFVIRDTDAGWNNGYPTWFVVKP